MATTAPDLCRLRVTCHTATADMAGMATADTGTVVAMAPCSGEDFRSRATAHTADLLFISDSAAAAVAGSSF